MSFIKKILSTREEKLHVEYRHEFSTIKSPRQKYSFPCSSNGALLHDDHYDSWIRNYNLCISHPEKYEDKGIVEFKIRNIESIHALCSCGNEIVLHGDTRCSCGQLYNGFGQPLEEPSERIIKQYDDDYYEARLEGF